MYLFYFLHQGQYSGIQAIFQKCFLLLKAMARGNPEVQRRLFDRLDMLLTIEGAEAEMAEALTEVNKRTNKQYHFYPLLHHFKHICL